MIPRIITNNTVTVHLNGDILSANIDHPSFQEIRAAALSQDWDTFKLLIDIKAAIEVYSDGKFTIDKNTVLYKGEAIPTQLESRILSFIESKAPFAHLLEFYENLIQNPSKRSIDELYSFLEHRNIPIGEDGCFYAYKSVRPNFDSWHRAPNGSYVPNLIGATIGMERRYVDDDANRGCSYGYHVGSLEYANNFNNSPGRKILICRINPKNVVSVPHDCNHQKVRTCEYEVVQEYTGPLPDTFWSPTNIICDRDSTEIEIENLEDEITDIQDQISRLKTAVAASEDADANNTIINGLLDALSDKLNTLVDLELELRDLKQNNMYEG